MIKTLSQEAIGEAHHHWATMLSRQANAETFAARIAIHFFAAGEPGRAVAHAILAAEDAERRAAITEAGRWYARVVDHVDGPEKIKTLRNAARCYHKADFPLAAADHYRKLAKLVDDEERTECLLREVILLIRSGRFSQARDQLQQFAASLGLPKPKPAWKSKLALISGQLLATLPGKHALMRTITDLQSDVSFQDEGSSSTSASPAPLATIEPKPSPSILKKLRAMRLCDSLIRPMSLFDNFYAAELSLAGSRLSLKYGTRAQRIHFAIGESVFACYDKGNRRIEGETNLLTLKPHVAELDCPFTTGELWSGIAYSHALACRWEQVSQPVNFSLQHYQKGGNSLGFEVAHTQWLDLWAKWNLGRWSHMREIAEQMLDDALRRNDLLQQMLTTGGFGIAAWLASDSVDQWERRRASDLELNDESQPTQILHVFNWIASLQLLIYQGQFKLAWDRYESLEPALRRLPYSNMQLFRVTREMLGALTAIHNFSVDHRNTWRIRAQARIDQLRQEQLAYATTLANFFEGLLKYRVAQQEHSSSLLEEARRLLTDAKNQANACRLRPFQLAAVDKLTEIQTGQPRGSLLKRMDEHGIVRPECFMRLYTLSKE